MTQSLEERAAKVVKHLRKRVRSGILDNGVWNYETTNSAAQSAITSLAREYAAECVEEAGKTCFGHLDFRALAERIRKGEGR